MADVVQHLSATGPDVKFLGCAANGSHQAMGLVERAGAGSKTRHRIGENVAARELKHIHRLRADQQGMR